MQYRYIALEAVVLLLLYTLKIIQDILVLWFVLKNRFKKSSTNNIYAVYIF